MRVYLAGPMRGYPNGNQRRFDDAARLLRGQGHTVFSPSEQAHQHPEMSMREGLAADLVWICEQAETVVLLPGSHLSPGTQAEIALARAIGIGVVDFESFVAA